jgi:hypothetical protein
MIIPGLQIWIKYNTKIFELVNSLMCIPTNIIMVLDEFRNNKLLFRQSIIVVMELLLK